jgi:hypothetical protein
VGWKGALIAGVGLAVAGTVLGEPALSAATLACGGLGIFGLLAGTARHETHYRAPWHALAASIALFLVAAIVSGWASSCRPPSPSWRSVPPRCTRP